MQISQPCLCPGCVDLKSVEYLYLFVRILPSTSLSWPKLCIKRLNIWNWRKICRKVIPNIDMKFRPKVPIFPRKRLAITAEKCPHLLYHPPTLHPTIISKYQVTRIKTVSTHFLPDTCTGLRLNVQHPCKSCVQIQIDAIDTITSIMILWYRFEWM